jgi:hypothetical protein
MMGNDEHHIHPKFMDNPKGLGKKYHIAEKEHIKLHLIIPWIIWKYIPENEKQKCIDEVINFSEQYINEYQKTNNKQIEEYNSNKENIIICPYCGYENDIEDKYCNRCDKVIVGGFEDK